MEFLNTSKLILCFFLLGSHSGCNSKDNKPTENEINRELVERDILYCQLSKPIYDKYEKTIEPNCDAALFTSIHGLQCGYVNPGVFEYQNSGKLCRRPECTCYDNNSKGLPSSKSGFSKDMAVGMQLYYSVKPDKDLAVRVQEYGIANKWTVCSAEDSVTLLGTCVMSPKIIYRWAEIERKSSSDDVKSLSGPYQNDWGYNLQNTGSAAHLDILSIITEYNLYHGISDKSIEIIKKQANREPNNLVFQAMLATFVTGNRNEIGKRLIKEFPRDRLPTSNDWCEPFKYQRDEIINGDKNKDWLPCDENKTHPGTHYLLASYILQLGENGH